MEERTGEEAFFVSLPLLPLLVGFVVERVLREDFFEFVGPNLGRRLKCLLVRVVAELILEAARASAIVVLVVGGAFMGDEFVTLDAGLSFFKGNAHLFCGTFALFFEMHCVVAVAVPALA